jgi:hypothetical protein
MQSKILVNISSVVEFATLFLFPAGGLKQEVYGFLPIGYLELQYPYLEF